MKTQQPGTSGSQPPPAVPDGAPVAAVRTSDLEDAAGRVIELTNTLGATAADVQAATSAVRTVRELARSAARRPERLALLGVGMIVAAGLLALRREETSQGQSQAPEC